MKKLNLLSFYMLLLAGTFMIPFSSCRRECHDTATTIKVGVLLGMTGSGSQNAVETNAALQAGLQDIKDYISQNGLDATVELLVEDTKSDTAEAKIKAQQLIDKGVSVIIGPYTSAEAKAVKAIANENHVLLVSHSAVSTSLAIAGDNFLRFAPCDTYQAEAMNALFSSDSVRAIIPVVRNDLWSNSLILATGSLFTSGGGTLISQQSFEPGTSDFSSAVAGVKAGLESGSSLYGADKTAIYLISYADGTGFLEALSNSGVSPDFKIYGASAFAQNATLLANATAAEYAYRSKIQCPVFGFDESASDIYEPIQTRITAAIGAKASIYALAAYDILWVTVLTSVTEKPGTDFAAFKSHFMETAGGYFGATGRTELDSNGDRNHVYYDFWKVTKEDGIYSWKLSAKYNTTSHLLIKY